MKRDRLVIYPKDVQVITGRGIRYAQRMLRVIRKARGKQENHLVTVDEFCEFSGLSRKDLDAYL